MRTAVPLFLVSMLAWTPSLHAQDAASGAKKSAAERRVDSAMPSYTRYLKLSQSQAEQFRALLLAQETARLKADKAKHAALEAVLTPDQKETYRKYWNRQPGANPWGNYNREANALAGVGLGLRTMKYQLKLSESQVEQLTKLLEPVGKTLLEAQAKRSGQAGGMRRWNAEAYKRYYAPMVKARDELLPKIRKVLTPDQQEKLTASLERYKGYIERYTDPEAWKKRMADARNKMAGRRGARPAVPRAPTVEQQVAAAVEALGIAADSDEAAVLQPMVKKVLAHRAVSESRLKALRRGIATMAAKDGVEESALQAKLTDLRKARKEAETRAATLEGELRELLSLEQEARLVGLGVLRP